ncbi:MAG: PQQ-binding-like beta-propeller repeat protein [Planctomycetes bacterium]|nr:PQQ-binding-like beta-propeller repeat protein [Planctomycetota bacterium]
MLLATVALGVLSGSPELAQVKEVPVDESARKADQVYALLRERCYHCHSEDHVAYGEDGDLTYLLKHDALVGSSLVDIKSPEKSLLYTTLNLGNMPRNFNSEGKPLLKGKLEQAHIDLVLSWIRSGAPKWAVAEPFVGTIRAHKETVHEVDFSYDNSCIMTCSSDKAVAIWNTRSGEEIQRREYAEPVLGASFGRKGSVTFVLTVGGSFVCSETASGREIQKFRVRCSLESPMVVSADEKVLLTLDYDKARVWEIDSGKETLTLSSPGGGEPGSGFSAIAISLNGELVATGDEAGKICLWKRSSGQEVRTFEGHRKRIRSLAFSAGGEKLVSGSDDTTARVWEVSSGKEVVKYEGHALGVRSVSLSSNNKYLVTTGDFTTRVWDVESGRELSKIDHKLERSGVVERSEAVCASFAGPSGVCASGDAGGNVRIWRALENVK